MEHIELENGKVYYDKLGSGTPIIFIHPPGLGKAVFRHQWELAEDYCVIFPDFSGHGASTSILNGPIIDQYVQEIKAIIEAEGFREVILCGYSAGGMIAQEFAISYPSKIKALILSGGYPKVDTPGLYFMYVAGMYLLKKSPDYLARILAKSHARGKEFRKDLYNHISKTNVNHWYQFYQETLHYDCSDRLQVLLSPVLCIYGEKAIWINKHKTYYSYCPTNNIAIIKNGLHQVPSKNSHAFNQIIGNFLQSLL
ncbi:alpha/beta fold hydrolase [Aquibacillus kalidii]|uniref:alpha/beta fold hydrolase n=1 Tax=Aquibacillus kalidii TaxID=2762597 RepID=UPI0016450675|nr:alpha/beta hydrolase [Aquibacillus kalidii]